MTYISFLCTAQMVERQQKISFHVSRLTLKKVLYNNFGQRTQSPNPDLMYPPLNIL